MTINEAIKHAEEVAKIQENNAKSYPRPDKSVKGSGKRYNAYLKRAEEHRQLAEWLKELQAHREAWMKVVSEVDRHTDIHSDGELYIRNFDVKKIIAENIPRRGDRE